eukprot:g2997.t1
MSRDAVGVRIRGRAETTLKVQFKDAETVAEFKARVFSHETGEGKRCRLIASGKELQDAKQMGFYRLQEDACLHVMINDRGAVARAAAAAPAASPVVSSTASAPVPAAGSRPGSASEGAGFVILCTLTLAMVIAAWTVRMAFPDFFSSAATAFLLLLTSLQLAATLPLLKKAVATALGACSCWWRPSAGGSAGSGSRPSSASTPRVPGRRRQ